MLHHLHAHRMLPCFPHTFFVSVNTVGTLLPPCKVKTSLLSQSHLNPMQAKGKTRLETPCCRARAARGTKNNTSFPWIFEMKLKLMMLKQPGFPLYNKL